MDYALSGQRIRAARIQNSKAHLMGEVQKVFSDCDPDEMYVMPKAANTVKKSIRIRKLKRTE